MQPQRWGASHDPSELGDGMFAGPQVPPPARYIDRPPPQYPSLPIHVHLGDAGYAVAAPGEAGDLHGTTSSGDCSVPLTKERLGQHQRQFGGAGVVEGQRERGRGSTVREGSQEEVVAAVEPGPSRPLRGRLWRSWGKIRTSVVVTRARVHEMTWRQLLRIVVLVTLVMAGNAMQILMLNFWLASFPEGGAPGNYTAFAVPGILFSLFFVIALGVYVAVKRPGMRFARSWYGWGLLIGVGFCDTLNSWLATYAASHTSEVLQALFTNLCPLYAVFMSKWILHDPRTYLNGWITSVFVLTIAGILVASLNGLVETKRLDDGKVWIFIFFLSIPFRVLQNVWQSLYMIVYTRDPAFTEWLGRRFWRAAVAGESPQPDGGSGGGLGMATGAARGSLSLDGAPHTLSGLEPAHLSDPARDDVSLGDVDTEPGTARLLIAPPTSACPSERPEVAVDRERMPSANVSFGHSQSERAPPPPARGDGGVPLPSVVAAPALPQEIVSIRYHQGEDMIVKLVMLAGETVAQTCFTLALLPADALPWWGNSTSVRGTWDNFVEGIVCVVTIRMNFVYGFLYTSGFVFTYCGCAYLNHYSVALCSIVSQLSSPLTALLLVIVPSWNVHGGGDSPWYCNLIAIVFLSIAALVYVVWEEMTDAEKVEGERVLKMRKLRVRPLESDSAFPQDPASLQRGAP